MSSLPITLSILATVAYTSTFWYLLIHLLNKQQPKKSICLTIMALGLVLHGIVLWQKMVSPNGVDYNVFNVLSLTCWLMMALSFLFSTYRPVLGLNLLAAPVACSGLLIGVIWHAPYVALSQGGAGLETHIITSLAAYCVLFMASIQSILLWAQNRELKHKTGKRLWVALLPPLQSMEKLLFDMILLGFGLLTIALLFGAFTVENFLSQHLAHKTVFSVLSWLVFGALLWGHWRLGWRGQRAVSFTLWGFALLVIGFIGTKLVLEIFLNIPA